jgi:diguanylate cyclase (GGDEF)-like protein/PAS domain S-box-containing protein
MEKRADAIVAGGGAGVITPEPGVGQALTPAPADSARMLATLIGNLDGAVFRCRYDAHWTMEFISEGCRRLTGYAPEELIDGRAVRFSDLIHPDDQAMWATNEDGLRDSPARYAVEYRLRHRDGSWRWVCERGAIVFDAGTASWKLEGLIEDITERRHSDQARHQAEERYHSIFEHALEGIFHSTPAGRILVANPALARILGFASPEALIAEVTDVATQLYVEPERRRELLRLLESNDSVSAFEFQAFRRNGEVIWLSVNAYARRDQARNLLFAEGTVEDITERRLYQAQIERQANYDSLTGLANRTLLNVRLRQAIERAAANGGEVAVAFIDLDQFKFINDTFGHELGDSLLQNMADRLRTCVREGDLVARQGGDEFVLLLTDYRHDDLASVIQRLHAAIAQPWQSGRRNFQVSSSIGVAVYPVDGQNPDKLLRNADAAMYKAKESGRNGYQFFTAELNRALVERQEIEQRLRGALARQQFLLHYQPRIDMTTGLICGAEALLRWRLPEQGLMSPQRFISVAEDTGLIVPIGRWVLHSACQQARSWQDEGLPPIVVSVNVSPRQFRDDNIVEAIAAALAASGLESRYLQIELTEGLAMHGAEKYVHMLEQIKQLGVQIAVDDFGTGYSSLSYLKRFPIDQLKVDRSFVTDLATDPNDAVIVQAIIALGHKLGLRVVAEGVETEEQLAFLQHCHCDEMQGFLFSVPIIAADFSALLGRQDFRSYLQRRQA